MVKMKDKFIPLDELYATVDPITLITAVNEINDSNEPRVTSVQENTTVEVKHGRKV